MLQTDLADAVFIPDSARWKNSRGKHVDPDECIKLIVDGDNNSADVRAEDGSLFCCREQGTFTEVEDGKVELLPELWVVKIDERDHWCPEITTACPRMYGVYVFDRKQHFHLCSFEACYELHFLGTQYDVLVDDDDEINTGILEGDSQIEDITYWSKGDIDRMLQTTIEEGFLPPEGEKSGGYKLEGIESIAADNAYEEAREAHQSCEL